MRKNKAGRGVYWKETKVKEEEPSRNHCNSQGGIMLAQTRCATKEWQILRASWRYKWWDLSKCVPGSGEREGLRMRSRCWGFSTWGDSGTIYWNRGWALNHLGEVQVGLTSPSHLRCLWVVQAAISSVKVKVWAQKVGCHFGYPHIKMRMTTGTEGREQEDPVPGPEGLEHSGGGLIFSCTCMRILHS